MLDDLACNLRLGKYESEMPLAISAGFEFQSSSEDEYDSDADPEFVPDANEISDNEIIVTINIIERKQTQQRKEKITVQWQ
ncbi:hypothetical protein J6590_019641 [Homalodisca vitripennis]|nr:hypothetical protein J6590_019641 [Homalodisca vitripennis]